jgi:hypothetical protein
LVAEKLVLASEVIVAVAVKLVGRAGEMRYDAFTVANHLLTQSRRRQIPILCLQIIKAMMLKAIDAAIGHSRPLF